MPHYTIPIGQDGPLLPMYVGVPDALRQEILAAGGVVPERVPVKLLIDTGGEACAIDVSVFEQLGLKPTGKLKIYTPSTRSGEDIKDLYHVQLSVAESINTYRVSAIAVHFLQRGFHGLVGRDFLQCCRLKYLGPNKSVSISFA